jgi:hypothetical protein
MVGVTIGIRNDMEVKRFDKIKDHVEIDMERKDGSEVLLTFTALEIAFMYYELRDLQSQVSNTDSLHDVMPSSLVSKVVFFQLKEDCKYYAEDGTEITTDMLMKHPHYITNDDCYLILN